MAHPGMIFLMYHELKMASRGLCQSEPGYVRYILPVETFRSQMKWLQQAGVRGLNVSQALKYPAGPGVCITFDDGCETDLIAAAPILRDLNLNATFYLTAGFLGKPGYLSAEQARELDAAGFEIGCHSMTHAYLSDLDEFGLKREIVEAKQRLEEIMGHEIEHFSCPGGRYNARTIAVARSAGFRSVANSEFHENTPATSAYDLGRVAMLRDLPLGKFGAVCRGQGLWKKRLWHQIRRGLQKMIGNRMYDRVRGALLGESPE